jgi:Helicase conserved C-terminal domain
MQTNSFSVIESNLDAICVTPRRNRQEMLRYVHRPTIYKLLYAPSDPEKTLEKFPLLRRLFRVKQAALMEPVQPTSALALIRDPFFGLEGLYPSSKKEKGWPDQITRFYHKAAVIYEDLGGWAGDYFILQTIDALRTTPDMSDALTGDISLRSISSVKGSLLKALDKPDFKRPIESFGLHSDISAKVEALIAFLLLQNADETSGLIFVQQRVMVSVLHAILSSHPRIAGAYRCATFVGMSGGGHKQYKLSELLDLREQKHTMTNFRSGLKNLVIATDALEEGIDVAACNLVICFDQLQTLKSFIQRRGRARKEHSKFAILSSDAEEECKLASWQNLEKALIKEYQNEERARKSATDMEDIREIVDYELSVESTG